MSTAKRLNPSDFLRQMIGKPVVVKVLYILIYSEYFDFVMGVSKFLIFHKWSIQLNSGVDYRGILSCLDGFMNIALEQTEEYVDGQLQVR